MKTKDNKNISMLAEILIRVPVGLIGMLISSTFVSGWISLCVSQLIIETINENRNDKK